MLWGGPGELVDARQDAAVQPPDAVMEQSPLLLVQCMDDLSNKHDIATVSVCKAKLDEMCLWNQATVSARIDGPWRTSLAKALEELS
jgi:hypothetical protein